MRDPVLLEYLCEEHLAYGCRQYSSMNQSLLKVFERISEKLINYKKPLDKEYINKLNSCYKKYIYFLSDMHAFNATILLIMLIFSVILAFFPMMRGPHFGHKGSHGLLIAILAVITVLSVLLISVNILSTRDLDLPVVKEMEKHDKLAQLLPTDESIKGQELNSRISSAEGEHTAKNHNTGI